MAQKLTSILNAINSRNDEDAWECLFPFPRCLGAPKRGGHGRNLAVVINQTLLSEENLRTPPVTPRAPKHGGFNNLATQVSAKLEEGNFKGAVRLASSSGSICIPDERSLEKLRQKHPSAHSDSSYPPAPPSNLQDHLTVNATEVRKAIMSFPAGSAGGPDRLLPQHLKDLTSPALGDTGTLLVESLADFVTLVISGKVP
jgi:hypothetical protein